MSFDSFCLSVQLIGIAVALLGSVFMKSKLDKLALYAFALIASGSVLGLFAEQIVRYYWFCYDSIVFDYNTAIFGFQWDVETKKLSCILLGRCYDANRVFNFSIILAASVIFALYKWYSGLPRTKKVVYGYEPEKMKTGSSFQLNSPPPAFQAEVHGSLDGRTYHPMGQGFWVDEGFITAAHVLHDMEFVILRRDDNELQLTREDFTFLDADMAIYKIKPQETQKLGLSKGKLSTLAINANSGLMAQVVAYGKRSFGFLNTYPQFGYCTYEGSTLAGFSGAPYYLNKQIFGMHLGGNIDNLGYESSYIRSILRPTKTIKNGADYSGEDSSEWLIEQAGRAETFDYDRSPYDPDEYRVKINGRYHIVEGDVLGSMLQKSKGRQATKIEYEFESLPQRVAEKKSEVIPQEDELPLAPRTSATFAESGNLIRAPAVVAGARGKEPVQVHAPVRASRTLSPTGSVSRTSSEASLMVSLESTHAQQKGVSKTTRRRQKKESELQALRNSFNLLSSRLKAMENGGQTSQQPQM